MQCLTHMTLIAADTFPTTKYLQLIYYFCFPSKTGIRAIHTASQWKPKENTSLYFSITNYQASANKMKKPNMLLWESGTIIFSFSQINQKQMTWSPVWKHCPHSGIFTFPCTRPCSPLAQLVWIVFQNEI